MQQSQVTVYADIGEVRMEIQAAACNQLIADGWVLLGIYPLTTVGEMTEGTPSNDSRRNSSRTPSVMSGN
jgi:hypothetical protein